MSRIRAWLRARGSTAEEGEVEIDELVRAALELIQSKSGLRVASGEYFEEKGRAQNGRIFFVGPVAAIAKEDPPRPLVRTEDGSLKTVSGLKAQPPVFGERAVLVDALLFDPRESSALFDFTEETFVGWLEKGGPIMWPLVLLAGLGLLVALERTFALSIYAHRVGLYERNPFRPLTAGSILFPLSRVLEEGSLEELEERATEGLRQIRRKLWRGLFVLAVVAAVAPLMVLLGTVTGMIGTFAVITEHGTGDPRLLSEGISEALLTTQLGLTIAVPALLAHAVLARLAERVFSRLDALFTETVLQKKREASRG